MSKKEKKLEDQKIKEMLRKGTSSLTINQSISPEAL